jgi:hypothetical protein
MALDLKKAMIEGLAGIVRRRFGAAQEIVDRYRGGALAARG